MIECVETQGTTATNMVSETCLLRNIFYYVYVEINPENIYGISHLLSIKYNITLDYDNLFSSIKPSNLIPKSMMFI